MWTVGLAVSGGDNGIGFYNLYSDMIRSRLLFAWLSGELNAESIASTDYLSRDMKSQGTAVHPTVHDVKLKGARRARQLCRIDGSRLRRAIATYLGT
jgi:hypothetical protein